MTEMAGSSVEHPRCLLHMEGELGLASDAHLLTVCGRGERLIVTTDSFAAVRQAGQLRRALGLTPLQVRQCGMLLELHVRGNKVATSEQRGLRFGKQGWRLFPRALLRASLGLTKSRDATSKMGS